MIQPSLRGPWLTRCPSGRPAHPALQTAGEPPQWEREGAANPSPNLQANEEEREGPCTKPPTPQVLGPMSPQHNSLGSRRRYHEVPRTQSTSSTVRGWRVGVCIPLSSWGGASRWSSQSPPTSACPPQSHSLSHIPREPHKRDPLPSGAASPDALRVTEPLLLPQKWLTELALTMTWAPQSAGS